MATKSRGIIVLGMHRAGTSATGNVLVNLGFELPSEPVPPKPDNPKGYWEPRSIVEIHDDFLHDVGHSWSDPRPLEAGLFHGKPAAAARERLREALRREVSPCRRWMIKDPRMCRLMPLWDGLFEAEKLDVGFLHVLRSPLSVADSLEQRDRFSREKSLLLWLRHNLEAEAATRGKDRSWLHFEQLADGASPSVIQALRAVTASPRLPEKRILAVIGEVLDPSGVHHQHGFGESLEDLESHAWIVAGYRALASLNGDDAAAGMTALDELRAEIDRADSLQLGNPELWEAELAGERYFQLRKEIERYQASVEVQRREIEVQRTEVGAMRDALATEQERHGAVIQKIEQLVAGQASTEQERRKIAGSLAALESQRKQLESLQATLRSVAEEPVTTVAKSLAALEAQPQQIEAIRRALKGYDERLTSITDGLSSIEHGIVDRVEKRHLVLLSKSMEVVSQIESRWMNACEQLKGVTEERDAALGERDSALGERDSALGERDAALGERDSALGERDAALGERDAALGERDAALGERDSALGERDDSARSLARVLEQRAAADAGRQQAESEFGEARSELERVRQERDGARAEVAQMQQRASWKITAPLRALIGVVKGRRS